MFLFPSAVLWISLSPSFSQQFLSISITFSSLISKKYQYLSLPSSTFPCTLSSYFLFGWKNGMASQIFTSLLDKTWHTHIIRSYKELMFRSPFFLRSHFLIYEVTSWTKDRNSSDSGNLSLLCLFPSAGTV